VKYTTLAISFLLFASGVFSLPGCRASTGDDRTASQQVDDLFAPLTVGIQPGAAVMVIRDAEVVHEGHYGFADISKEKPITAATNFRLASVSKQFATMAIMILADDGLLQYEDPVSKYVPDLTPYEGVTIRHLLQHTGGMPDYYDVIDTSDSIPTNVDAAKLLGEMASPDFLPGERYEYSNPGYDMLGPVVEAASGIAFVEFVRERIFKPLKMHTSLVHDHTFPDIPNRAFGYDIESGEFVLDDYDPLNGIVGSGGIYSNLNDMYRWDQSLYTNDIVSEESLRSAFIAGTTNSGESIDYGFGWRIEETRGLKHIRHSGSWVGFRTHILRIPELKFSVVILSNRGDFSSGDYVDAVRDIYLGIDETPTTAH